MRDVSKDEIIDKLTDRIEELVCDLFPSAEEVKGKPIILPEPGIDGTSSFQVYTGKYGKKVRGQWNRFSARLSGGPLELIMYAHANVITGKSQWYDALVWAKGWLGLSAPETPAQRQARERRAAERREREELRHQAIAARAMRDVRGMIAGTVEVTNGDPVWTYLTAARHLPIAAVPAALRLHPDLPHFSGGEVNGIPWRGPAMIARLSGASGCHVTFLKPDGKGKAPLGRKAKLMRGDVAGGFVQIANPDGRRLSDLVADGELVDVLVCEGIETGLALSVGAPDVRIWAALSLGNIAALPLNHEAIHRIYWAVENDIKPAALDAQDHVRAALAAHGKPVIEIRSPKGSDFADLF